MQASLREYAAMQQESYRRASRADKRRLMDEVVTVTGILRDRVRGQGRLGQRQGILYQARGAHPGYGDPALAHRRSSVRSFATSLTCSSKKARRPVE